MKNITLLLASLFVISCSCKKSTTTIENSKNETSSKITSTCPDDGKCTAIVYKNKKVDLLRDNLGKVYYQISDSESTSVVKYEYIRNELPNTQDSSYREEIVFELNNNEKEANYSNFDLRNQKFLFGRFCFCRGQTGYYQITDGTIKLENSKLNVSFATTEVPQIIKSFVIDIK